MRIVIDMCLPRRWAEEFSDSGIQVDHWSDIGLPAEPDEGILKWATTNSAVILTKDYDFSTLLALSGATGPSVVLVAHRRIRDRETCLRVRQVIEDHLLDLENGALIVISESRHRFRILPLTREPGG